MSLFCAFTQRNQKKKKKPSGLHGGGLFVGTYFDLFPKSQLFVPRLEYPLWDSDWDLGRTRRSLQKLMLNKNPPNRTRHIFLVRHGQFREDVVTSDAERVLTEKGRDQAKATGIWLAELIRTNNCSTSTARWKKMSCSPMVRAQQTADIVYQEIDGMYKNHNYRRGEDESSSVPWVPLQKEDPDPLLREGRPCHHLPSFGETLNKTHIRQIQQDWPRMEAAFSKYIAKSHWSEDWSSQDTSNTSHNPSVENKSDGYEREHEYQIIVSHSNIIRYMVCRALQIPPEAWMRLNLFNGSITYLVVHSTGEVSLRMLGEVGHMRHDLVSFDLYEGFNWDSNEFFQREMERMKDELLEDDETTTEESGSGAPITPK